MARATPAPRSPGPTRVPCGKRTTVATSHACKCGVIGDMRNQTYGPLLLGSIIARLQGEKCTRLAAHNLSVNLNIEFLSTISYACCAAAQSLNHSSAQSVRVRMHHGFNKILPAYLTH